MKRSRLYPAMISAATLFLASSVIAGSDKNEYAWSPKMSTGPVEIDEIRASQSARLQKLDEDGDGSVSRDEFRSGAQLRHQEHSISMAEIEEIAADAVESIDIERIKDRVLALTNGEQGSKARRIIIRKAHSEDLDPDDLDIDVDVNVDVEPSRDRMRYVMPDHWSNLDRTEWFDIVDANEDGVLDRDEVAGARDQLRTHGLDQRFDMLDANKDGQLNDEDIDSRLQKLQALDEDGDGSVSRRELGEVIRLLGENRMIDQAHVIRLRRDNGHR